MFTKERDIGMLQPTVLFMGSSPFSLEILQEICDLSVTLSAVYTQPPKPAGRGKHVTKNPVHLWAEKVDLPVYTPQTLRSVGKEAFSCDAIIVAAYGLILPEIALATPRYGSINVHASLLPRWRGAAPVQRAILAGDTETGITLIHMDQGLDTGAILATLPVPILPEMTAGELLAALAQTGRQIIRENIASFPLLLEKACPQPTTGITYAHKITPQEAHLHWDYSAIILDRIVRAFHPIPGAWFFLEGKRIKVFKIEIISNFSANSSNMPGTILDASFTLACADGHIRLLEIQPEGKNRMSGVDFLRGHTHLIGRTL
ncbi:MAG: methionyl-tRNA formyltransferase [Holosporales bacterium]|jgi:methionyl-tRNA formyltransferase|nr:methionyl-tRNA formyltransferase [Holosporales bacterium]